MIKEIKIEKKLKIYKDLYETYSSLYKSSFRELQFANLQREHLYSVLDELITFTSSLEKDVIKNALDRYQLDKLIHAKLLFKDDVVDKNK